MKPSKRIEAKDKIASLPVPSPKIAALLIWIALVWTVYWTKNSFQGLAPLSMLMDRLANGSLLTSYSAKCLEGLGILFGLWWSLGKIGAAALDLLGLGADASPEERVAYSMGFGLLGLSLWSFFLAAVGLYSRSSAWISLAAMLGAGIYLKKRSPGIPWQAARSAWKAFSFPARALLIALFLLHLAESLSPEIFYDSLYYHLVFPNLYRLAGRMHPIYENIYTNFPSCMEMLYGFAMLLQDEMLAKLFHFMTSILCIFAFLAVEKRFLSKGAGALGTLIYFAIPLVVLNGWTTGIEVGWTFAQLMAFHALLMLLRETDDVVRPPRGWAPPPRLVAAGLMAGFSMSFKYPAFAMLPAAGLLLGLQRTLVLKRPWKQAASEVLAFGLLATAIVTPWLVKNILYHANPVYPFLATRFGHPLMTPEKWLIFMGDTHAQDFKSVFSSGQSFFRFLAHPWFMTMEGNSNADFVGPLFVSLLPLFLLVRKQPFPLGWAKLYLCLMWLVWVATSTMPRFFMPYMGVGAILMGGLFASANWPRWAGPLIKGVVYAGLLSTFTALSGIYYGMGGWQVLFGYASKDAYLSEQWPSYPTPPYEGFAWMNQNLPKDAKVIIVGDARSYYTDRYALAGSIEDPPTLLPYAEKAQSGAELARLLRQDGITHLFLNFGEAWRVRGDGILKTREAVLDDFWENFLTPIWHDMRQDPRSFKALYVFKIRLPEEAEPPHPKMENLLKPLYKG